MPRLSSILLLSVFGLTCWSTTGLANGAEDQRNYIEKWKEEAIRQMAIYRIPASITLAQGLLESGSGKSQLSAQSNNHFGIKCHRDWQGGRTYYDDDAKGECFRVYADARDSFEDHSLFLKRKRYESLFALKIDDYKGWARGLKRCGYATSPTYAKALIELIERHNLDDYDTEGIRYIEAGIVPDRPGDEMANSNVPGGGREVGSDRSGSSSTIHVGGGRTSGITENDVSWIEIRSGETLDQLAREMDLAIWQFRKYNDLDGADGNTRFDANRRLFTQPKRRRGRVHWHTVVEGETLRTISDMEAVKLKVLVKRTGFKPNQKLEPGLRIPLRFAPNEDGRLPWFARAEEKG